MTYTLRTPEAPQSRLPAKQNLDLQSLEREMLSIKDYAARIDHVQAWFHQYVSDQNAVYVSSFGTESPVKFQFANNAGRRLPIISIDIPDAKYDISRKFRAHLSGEMKLDVRVFNAVSQDDKGEALNRALRSPGIKAGLVFNGLRAAQHRKSTDERVERPAIWFNNANGTLEVSPFHDMSDDELQRLTAELPESLRHPNQGKVTWGGAVLDNAQDKDFCEFWPDAKL